MIHDIQAMIQELCPHEDADHILQLSGIQVQCARVLSSLSHGAHPDEIAHAAATAHAMAKIAHAAANDGMMGSDDEVETATLHPTGTSGQAVKSVYRTWKVDPLAAIKASKPLHKPLHTASNVAGATQLVQDKPRPHLQEGASYLEGTVHEAMRAVE